MHTSKRAMLSACCWALVGAGGMALIAAGRSGTPTLATGAEEPSGASTLAASRDPGARERRALMRRLSSLESQLLELEAAEATDAEDSQEGAEAIDGRGMPDPSDTEAYQRAVLADERAKNDARFEQELPDPEWAPAFERKLQEVVDTEAFEGSRLAAIECRSSLCMLEVHHDDEAAERRFADTFPEQAPTVSSGWAEPIEGTTSPFATRLYLSREGHRPLGLVDVPGT